MGVEITAENSNNKSITIFGTYSFIRNVEVTAGEHGSLSQAYKKDVLLDTEYSVNGNKLTIGDAEVTAVADNGYKFDSWKIGDQVITTSGKVTVDTQFTATFVAKNSFSVTALAGEHGSVSLTEPLTIEEGTAYTVNGNEITIDGTEIIATADEGFEFDSWKIGDAVLTEGGTFTADTTFAAEFKAVEVPPVDPEPEQKGLSGGAIAGIAVGSILIVCLILYIAMFFVWKKHDKALKFLIPSFKWINKKIFKK